MAVEAVFLALGSALKLWASAESRKYLDKYFKLKREYHEEISKPEHLQDFAVLDNIEWELNLLCIGLNTAVGSPQPKNTP